METWYKYDYVCSICDALIEITTKSNVYKPQVCCGEEAIWMSVVDATINPINQTKENKMDNTYTLTDPTLVPITNPDQLISYELDGGKFTQKISDIANTHRKYNNLVTELHNHNNKVFLVDNIISSRFEDSDDQDTLKEIAQALGISITKEITWSATVTIQGTAEVDITDEYDLESIVYDNLSGCLYEFDFSIDNVDEDN
jgi:hypothetical protein